MVDDHAVGFGDHREPETCSRGHVPAESMITILSFVLPNSVEHTGVKGNENGNTFLGGNFVYSNKS